MRPVAIAKSDPSSNPHTGGHTIDKPIVHFEAVQFTRTYGRTVEFTVRGTIVQPGADSDSAAVFDTGTFLKPYVLAATHQYTGLDAGTDTPAD